MSIACFQHGRQESFENPKVRQSVHVETAAIHKLRFCLTHDLMSSSVRSTRSLPLTTPALLTIIVGLPTFNQPTGSALHSLLVERDQRLLGPAGSRTHRRCRRRCWLLLDDLLHGWLTILRLYRIDVQNHNGHIANRQSVG